MPALLALVGDPDLGLRVHFPAEHLNSCGNKKESAIALGGSHYSGSTPYFRLLPAGDLGLSVFIRFLWRASEAALRGVKCIME
jgi:hypothetical protein